MNGYVLTVVGTVLISSILTMLIPEGKCSAMIKGVTKLACLIVLLSPIPKLLGDETFFDVFRGENTENTDAFFRDSGLNADEPFIKYYCELRIRETQTAVEREIVDKFGVQSTVKLDWNFLGETDVDKLQITKITIQLQQAVSEEVQRKMCTYLTENYCSEVLIE